MSDAVVIKNLKYRYSDGIDALEDICLTIEQGQKVALIGPNGAGKSTLLLAMNMFIKAEGTITIGGVDVCRKNEKQIRRLIGFVQQNPDDQLFMPTVFDDVAFGPLNMGMSDEQVIDRTKTTLRTVGLTSMGDRTGHHLSAGQKRAAAIATILSMDPEIITMDEPDTSLDPRTRNHLVDLLKSLDQTIIIATCNMEFAARLCTRVILIDDGKIIADGSSDTVLSDGNLMSKHGLEVPSFFLR